MEILTEIEQLQQQIDHLEKENARLREICRNAKDISPVQKVSFRRVLNLAREACMDLVREGAKYVLKMGTLIRAFKSLREIWEILIQEDWHLTDIFPPNLPVKRQRSGCKFCGQAILWARKLGGWIPMEPDSDVRHRCLSHKPKLEVPW